jgi:hypothetical protein
MSMFSLREFAGRRGVRAAAGLEGAPALEGGAP